jgi:hypothetical protein
MTQETREPQNPGKVHHLTAEDLTVGGEEVATLKDSVRKQRDLAKQVLNQVKQIDNLLVETKDNQQVQEELKKLRDVSLLVAEQLASNVVVSSTATSGLLTLIDNLVANKTSKQDER